MGYEYVPHSAELRTKLSEHFSYLTIMRSGYYGVLSMKRGLVFQKEKDFNGYLQ